MGIPAYSIGDVTSFLPYKTRADVDYCIKERVQTLATSFGSVSEIQKATLLIERFPEKFNLMMMSLTLFEKAPRRMHLVLSSLVSDNFQEVAAISGFIAPYTTAHELWGTGYQVTQASGFVFLPQKAVLGSSAEAFSIPTHDEMLKALRVFYALDRMNLGYEGDPFANLKDQNPPLKKEQPAPKASHLKF